MAEPKHWTIPEVSEAFAAGGARAVVEQHLERRVGASPPEAWIFRVAPDALRARAAQVDAQLAAGADLPLAGVPFAVKDNIDVAGVPTTAACAEYSFVPDADADVVERLLDAGGIFVGKTNLDQFATGLVGTRSPQYGACRNPLVGEFIAGGSSSGSAIAVATGEVPLALGTDTAGSGRVPAALCGVVGLKPTPGLLSTRGIVPAMLSYDCVSAFTATVADAALVLDVLSGRSRSGARRSPAPGPTVLAIPDGIDWHDDDDARERFATAVARARDCGMTVVEVDGAPLRAAGELLYGSALVADRYSAFGRFAAEHPEAIDPAVAEIVGTAGAYTGVEVFDALAALEALRTRVDPMWTEIDALLLPTVARVPTFAEAQEDRLGPSRELGELTAFVNPLTMAAVAVPAGVRTSGVPFGVSFVGPAGSDVMLLDLGAAFGDEELASSDPLAARPLRLAVVGAHLAGQPLHHQLVEVGAELCATTTTAPEYRLFALDTSPPKPGLLRAPGGAGAAIAVEVYALDAACFGGFVAAIPAPLGIGRVVLADGTEVPGFLCEPYATEGAREITEHGGWVAYLAATV
jgi:allophanate hydrolase